MSTEKLIEDVIQDAAIEVDEGRSEANFIYTFRNCSKRLRNPKAIICSPTFYVKNIPWTIKIDTLKSRYLEFDLGCNLPKNGTFWWCDFSCKFKILPVESNLYSSSREFTDEIGSEKPKHHFQTYHNIIPLLQPKNGFIKDDAISLEMYISANKISDVPCTDNKKDRTSKEEANDLIQAITRQDLDKCKALLKQSEYRNMQYNGRTPLMWAAYKGNLKIVQLLVEADYKINTADYFGYSPLMRAVEFGHIDVAKYLLQRGAEINFSAKKCTFCTFRIFANFNSFTALHFVVHHMKDKGSVAEFLINNGADLFFVNEGQAVQLIENGARSKVNASTTAWSIRFKKFTLAKMLLQTEEHINDRWSLLTQAVYSKDTEIVEILLEKGANPSKRDGTGRSPFLESILTGKLELVECFLKRIPRFMVRSALHTAVLPKNSHSIPIITILLQNGANVNLIGEDGDTPLMKSIKLGNDELTELLVAHGADVNLKDKTPIFEAIKIGSLKIVEILLDNGVNANLIMESGETPLTKSIKLSNYPLIELLIRRGADVNLKDGNGHIPLFEAIKVNDVEIVKLLLTKGLNFKILDGNGCTPLIHCIQKGNLKILQVLVEGGADVTESDKNGTTPLMECLHKEKSIFFNFLVDKVADSSFSKELKETILSIAIETQNVMCVGHLIDRGVDFSSCQHLLDKLAEDNFDFSIYLNEAKKTKVNSSQGDNKEASQN